MYNMCIVWALCIGLTSVHLFSLLFLNLNYLSYFLFKIMKIVSSENIYSIWCSITIIKYILRLKLLYLYAHFGDIKRWTMACGTFMVRRVDGFLIWNNSVCLNIFISSFMFVFPLVNHVCLFFQFRFHWTCRDRFFFLFTQEKHEQIYEQSEEF